MSFINRRNRMYLMTFVILMNFLLGLVIFSSSISTTEEQQFSSKVTVLLSEKSEQFESTHLHESSINDRYDYYFRIDYILKRTRCISIEIFNRSSTIESIHLLTNAKINQLFTPNVHVDIHIISFTPILSKTIDQSRQNSTLKSKKKSFCDYTLQLYIAWNFPSNCTIDCQFKEIERLISTIHPFGHPVNPSFTFEVNSFRSKMQYDIQEINLYRSSKYHNRLVSIRSFAGDRYVSALILDSEGEQRSLTMTDSDQSVFLIKDSFKENHSSNISVSFVSYSMSSLYIRHQNGRIQLDQNDQTILFKEDSTFRLLINENQDHLTAFQSINIPQSYISIDNESQRALILRKSPNEPLTIDDLDQQFLFKLTFR